MAAVQAVKSSDPQQEAAGNHAILIYIEEMGHAARLAAEANLPIDESFVKLVEGAAANADVNYETAVTSITALLRGVLILLDNQDPGRVYSSALLEWYEEGSVLTYYGLVSLASRKSEARYLGFFSSHSSADLSEEDLEELLGVGYENCAAASFNDVDWWVAELTSLVEESPPSVRTDDAFGYLANVELAVSELCPQYGQTWDSTKSVLAGEAWYPKRADFPNIPDELAGLFE